MGRRCIGAKKQREVDILALRADPGPAEPALSGGLILGVFLNTLVAMHRLFAKKWTGALFIAASVICLIFLFLPMHNK